VAPGVTLLSGADGRGRVRTRAQLTPLRTLVDARGHRARVRFLLESPAITGTTLLVDGGQHLQAQPRDVLFLASRNA
jgi:hypothetical protein